MKITVEVRELKDNEMFFHEEFGKGDFAGEKFDAVRALPSNSLIITYRGKRYMVESEKIMRAVLTTAHDEGKENAKVSA